VESSLPIEPPFIRSHVCSKSPESSLNYGATRLHRNFQCKAPEPTQLARGTLNRYLLILKRLILESSVRAGSPNFVAAPDGPETCP
jgi:hypothetical protein